MTASPPLSSPSVFHPSPWYVGMDVAKPSR